MKRKMMILAGAFCLFVTTLFGSYKLPVSANERRIPPYILDTSRQCKLQINTDKKQGTEGEELEIYQVGRIDATNLSLSFVLQEEFRQSEVNLMEQGNSKRRKMIDALYEHAKLHKISPVAKVKLDENGSAELLLPQGAYMIYQRQQEKMEEKTWIQPALVGLPDVGDLQNAWNYELEIQLKAAKEAVVTADAQEPMVYAALAGAAMLLLGLLMLARRRA